MLWVLEYSHYVGDNILAKILSFPFLTYHFVCAIVNSAVHVFFKYFSVFLCPFVLSDFYFLTTMEQAKLSQFSCYYM